MGNCICGYEKGAGWTICFKHWGNERWIKKLIKKYRYKKTQKKEKLPWCADCKKRHGALAVARIEYGTYPPKVISLPLNHCTEIKLVILKV